MVDDFRGAWGYLKISGGLFVSTRHNLIYLVASSADFSSQNLYLRKKPISNKMQQLIGIFYKVYFDP